jgi:hypothetical protein
MKNYEYNRRLSVDYAIKWALYRNPKYYNFDNDSYDIQLELKPDEDTY